MKMESGGSGTRILATIPIRKTAEGHDAPKAPSLQTTA
jgi:hypothetical protein